MAGNFSDHKMSKSASEDFVKKGFLVGKELYLKKRITIKYGKDNKHRQDANANTRVIVQGYTDEAVICRVPLRDVKKMDHIDWACKPDNLGVVTPEMDKAAEGPGSGSKGASGQSAVLKKYPFLKDCYDGDEPMGPIEVLAKIWDNDMSKDTEVTINTMKTHVQFMSSVIGTVVEDDSNQANLMIVKVGSEYQVWTLADFKAKSLYILPHSTSLKQRFYCSFRSAIAQGSEVGGDRRPLVFDGRLRGSPDGKHSFSMYWVVERTTDASLVNLQKEYAKVSFDASVEIGGRVFKDKWSADDNPKVPVLYNDEKIGKHTRLYALEDPDLAKLVATQEKQDAAAKAKEQEKAKAKAKEEGDGDVEPPKKVAKGAKK